MAKVKWKSLCLVTMFMLTMSGVAWAVSATHTWDPMKSSGKWKDVNSWQGAPSSFPSTGAYVLFPQDTSADVGMNGYVAAGTGLGSIIIDNNADVILNQAQDATQMPLIFTKSLTVNGNLTVRDITLDVDVHTIASGATEFWDITNWHENAEDKVKLGGVCVWNPENKTQEERFFWDSKSRLIIGKIGTTQIKPNFSLQNRIPGTVGHLEIDGASVTMPTETFSTNATSLTIKNSGSVTVIDKLNPDTTVPDEKKILGSMTLGRLSLEDTAKLTLDITGANYGMGLKSELAADDEKDKGASTFSGNSTLTILRTSSSLPSTSSLNATVFDLQNRINPVDMGNLVVDNAYVTMPVLRGNKMTSLTIQNGGHVEAVSGKTYSVGKLTIKDGCKLTLRSNSTQDVGDETTGWSVSSTGTVNVENDAKGYKLWGDGSITLKSAAISLELPKTQADALVINAAGTTITVASGKTVSLNGWKVKAASGTVTLTAASAKKFTVPGTLSVTKDGAIDGINDVITIANGSLIINDTDEVALTGILTGSHVKNWQLPANVTVNTASEDKILLTASSGTFSASSMGLTVTPKAEKATLAVTLADATKFAVTNGTLNATNNKWTAEKVNVAYTAAGNDPVSYKLTGKNGTFTILTTISGTTEPDTLPAILASDDSYITVKTASNGSTSVELDGGSSPNGITLDISSKATANLGWTSDHTEPLWTLDIAALKLKNVRLKTGLTAETSVTKGVKVAVLAMGGQGTLEEDTNGVTTVNANRLDVTVANNTLTFTVNGLDPAPDEPENPENPGDSTDSTDPAPVNPLRPNESYPEDKKDEREEIIGNPVSSEGGSGGSGTVELANVNITLVPPTNTPNLEVFQDLQQERAKNIVNSIKGTLNTNENINIDNIDAASVFQMPAHNSDAKMVQVVVGSGVFKPNLNETEKEHGFSANSGVGVFASAKPKTWPIQVSTNTWNTSSVKNSGMVSDTREINTAALSDTHNFFQYIVRGSVTYKWPKPMEVVNNAFTVDLSKFIEGDNDEFEIYFRAEPKGAGSIMQSLSTYVIVGSGGLNSVYKQTAYRTTQNNQLSFEVKWSSGFKEIQNIQDWVWVVTPLKSNGELDKTQSDSLNDPNKSNVAKHTFRKAGKYSVGIVGYKDSARTVSSYATYNVTVDPATSTPPSNPDNGGKDNGGGGGGGCATGFASLSLLLAVPMFLKKH